MTLQELIQRANADDKPRRRKPAEREHLIQVACVRWFRLQYPQLAMRLFAVPNGARRDKTTGAKLKAEGVLAGVADLILLMPNEHYGALLIEMKTEQKGSKQRDTQKRWQADITRNNEYRYVVCRSLDDFMREVNDYLKQNLN